jgi:hypothetical protein
LEAPEPLSAPPPAASIDDAVMDLRRLLDEGAAHAAECERRLETLREQ